MNAETKSFPHGDIRVSDSERDLAVAELSEHFQAGRLTQDEFDDRSGRALEARTGADLNTLFTDLPHRGAAPAASAPGPMMDPVYSLDEPRPPGGGLLVARAVIACAIVGTIAGDLFGYHGHPHGVGVFIPVVLLVLLFVHLTGRARRASGRC